MDSGTIKKNSGGGLMRFSRSKFLFAVVIAAITISSINFLNMKSTTSSELQSSSASATSLWASTGTISGSVFTGTAYRTYDGKRVFTEGWEKRVGTNVLTWDAIISKLGYYKKADGKKVENLQLSCEKWAIVTTIFPPSDALIDIAGLDQWCTVVIGDTKTASDWLTSEPKLKDNPTVFFVPLEEQKAWLDLPGEIGSFMSKVPYTHFARKNIGFLYAILRGATLVYDFDDDNYLNKDNSTGNLLPLLDDETKLNNVRYIDIETSSFNHHPLMEATLPTSWARGFPMELVQDESTHGKVKSIGNTVPMEKIGVIQFCADNNPDIDAVHRITKPLPMNFAPESTEGGGSSVLVPPNVYSPYNAQATLHTAQALFATLLPISVTSRVTDIWRGYFAQALFRDVGLSLIFAPPRITQYRNVHNILGDWQSEEDLYYKSGQLVKFLYGWKSTEESLPARMEELWIALYERGYIEESDVELVQLWLGTLVQIQYSFLTPK